MASPLPPRPLSLASASSGGVLQPEPWCTRRKGTEVGTLRTQQTASPSLSVRLPHSLPVQTCPFTRISPRFRYARFIPARPDGALLNGCWRSVCQSQDSAAAWLAEVCGFCPPPSPCPREHTHLLEEVKPLGGFWSPSSRRPSPELPQGPWAGCFCSPQCLPVGLGTKSQRRAPSPRCLQPNPANTSRDFLCGSRCPSQHCLWLILEHSTPYLTQGLCICRALCLEHSPCGFSWSCLLSTLQVLV